MFTGIVEEVGVVRERIPVGPALRFRLTAPGVAKGLKPGDSVACNGVCLTAEEIFPDGFTATAVPETLQRTTLGSVSKGDAINLEAALKAGSPMGGHIVQGHVDGVGEVSGWKDLPNGSGRELTIRIPGAFTRYCVEKGSLALHGVSLTIAAIEDDSIRIALVPHTLSHTNLGRLRAGDPLNFEVDLVGKYVEKLLGGHHGAAGTGTGAAQGKPALDSGSLGKWGYGV
ncbi:MAG: putative riboflavin synthase alpha subunit [Fibrobacteres bacterium]|nr:putative riboflavin synthase alpha subunit [Fibrobacterota bacterium]